MPSLVQSGANAVYTLLVTNTGGLSIPQVRVDDVLPSSGFDSAATFSTSRGGACLPLQETTLTCNLGAVEPDQTGTVTVTLTNVTAPITNNASVMAYQADGMTQLDDTKPTDNIGLVSTSIAPPPPPTTTDVQISGSASNGGPKVNTAISYTFKVRNGSDVATNTIFNTTFASSLRFTSANATALFAAERQQLISTAERSFVVLVILRQMVSRLSPST